MRIKRLWLEDIKYGLIRFEYRNFSDPHPFYKQRIIDVLGPFYFIHPLNLQTLEENAKKVTYDFPEDSSRLSTIREKHLTILSYHWFEPKFTLHENDVYYFGLPKTKLSALGCSPEDIDQLETRFESEQGVIVLNQCKLYFCNFALRPNWPCKLSQSLTENVWQLLLGLYSSQSSLFRLDLNVFHRIVFWLVELDNAYEEI